MRFKAIIPSSRQIRLVAFYPLTVCSHSSCDSRQQGVALRYKGAKAFSSLKAYFLSLFGALPQSHAFCLTSLKALSVLLSVSFSPSLTMALYHPLAVNAERARKK